MNVLLLGDLGNIFLGWLMGFLSVFLIMLILIQRGKGGGLTGALGGPGGQSAFGSKAGDTFTVITIVVASIWGLTCAFTMWLHRPDTTAPITKAEVGPREGDATSTTGGLDPTSGSTFDFGGGGLSSGDPVSPTDETPESSEDSAVQPESESDPDTNPSGQPSEDPETATDEEGSASSEATEEPAGEGDAEASSDAADSSESDPAESNESSDN